MSDQRTIETKGSEFQGHAEWISLVRDLLGGTKAMRKAGPTYLRKGMAEHQADYELRLNSTHLTGAYSRTLNFLVGQVFKKDIVLSDASEEILRISENIDNAGNNLSVFSASAFRSGLHSGVSFIMVDFSKVETAVDVNGNEAFLDPASGEWTPKTMAAYKRLGWRPYWNLIDASRVIDIWQEVIDGKPVMTHFRFDEDHIEDDGEWGKRVVKKIRVLEVGTWSLWAKDKDGNWVVEDSGVTGKQYIPIAVFRPGEPIGTYTAQPALQGLAELCEKHWQATAGDRHLMDWMRRPPFFGKCLGVNGEPVAFGPNRLVEAADPSADLKSVCVDAAATTASKEDLEKIEAEMALYGLRLLVPRAAATTATQHILESSESESALQRWAMAFKDCLEQAFVYTADWIGESVVAGVELNDKFEKIFDQQMFDVLLKAVSSRLIPKEMAYDAMRSILPIRDDVPWEEAKAMIEDDQRISAVTPLSAQQAGAALLSRTTQQG